jgi:RNA-directed DNA polymerase
MCLGVCVDRYEGTPQGGPLSPLLANIILDDLDKELERRGHKFCRYADDCNIYVKSQRAGERVMSSIKNFLEGELKLKVNESKSAVAVVNERKFLGFRLGRDGKISLAPSSLQRVKTKIYSKTRRTAGRSIEAITKELNLYLRGWLNYFALIETPSYIKDLDGWMRRRLRCLRLKQKKRSYPIAKWLIHLGVQPREAWNLAKSSKGWWRLSATQQLHQALNKEWFNKLGLISLYSEYLKLKCI